MKHLELIKAKLKEKGLSEGLSIFITVENENEIEQAVSALAANMQTKDGLAGLLTTVGLDGSMNSVLQSEGDRRVNQALKTAKEKAEEEAKKNDPLKTDPEGKKDEPTGTDKQIQALQAQITSLTETITGQVTQLNQAQITGKVKTAVVAAGLPEDWASRVIVDSEDKIADAVTGLKTEYDGIVQGSIDKHLEEHSLPKRSSSPGSVTEAAIKEFAEDMKSEDSDFPVQEMK